MRPPASPHRRAMPAGAQSAGTSAGGAGSSGGSAGSGSGGGKMMPMAALASPKRKRAETPVPPIAVDGSASSAAAAAAGADQLNVSLPNYGGNSGGIFAAAGSGAPVGGRPGLNKAASWDDAATPAGAAAAAAGAAASSFLAGGGAHYGGGTYEEEEQLLHLQEGDHPPPSVRKARRRSPGSFPGGQHHALGGGGGFGVGLEHQNVFMSRALGGSGYGGGDGGGRPSTAPAAMTPARNAAGQDIAAAAHTRQLRASSRSADGGRRGGRGGGGGGGGSHYWTRSKPYPPPQPQEAEQEEEEEPDLQATDEQEQQQQRFFFGQQASNVNIHLGAGFGTSSGDGADGVGMMFSPGLGGPPAPPPTAVKPPQPGCDEHTASTRSINLSNDSSLLALGLTPARPRREDDGAAAGGGGLSDVAECDGSDGGATVPNSPAAPFRFASFPASLPRVHAHHSRTQPTPGGPVGTGGSRRRARGRIDEAEAWSTAQAALNGGTGPANSSAAAAEPTANATAQHSHNLCSAAAAAPSAPLPPNHSAHRRPQSPNTSMEDTVNDSTVSSISIDHHGGQHHNQSQDEPPTASMHRYTRSDGTGVSSPRGGQWLGDDLDDASDGDGVGATAFAAAAAAAKSHGEDEDGIGRTRLDFSSLMSPEPKASSRKSAGSTLATAKKQQSFVSFHRRSFDGEDDAAIGHRIVDEGGVPLTPGAATLRFQLDETKVSPIPNGGGESKAKGAVPPQPLLADTRGSGPASATRRRRVPLSQRKNALSDTAAGAASENKPETIETGGDSSPKAGGKSDLELSAVSGVTAASSAASTEASATQDGGVGESIANTSQATGGSASTKQRKARPMPDMSAFDGGGMEDGSPSSGGGGMVIDPSISPGHLGVSGHSGPVPPPSPHKLICPPTPQRTPVWAAHAHQQEHVDPPQTGAHGSSKRFNIAGAFGPPGQFGGKFKLARADSLIATKVLAECPPQVLDGLSSLENSLMEDADKSGGSSVAGGVAAAAAAAASEADTYHDSGDLTGSLTASMDDEAMQPPFAPHTSGVAKSTGLSPIGEAPTPGTPGTPGGGMMEYDDGVGTPRRNLSLMDDMLDEGEGPASTPRHSQHASEGDAGERTPRKSQQQSQEFSAIRHISFNSDFENLGQLGSGAFADVYKVRSKADGLHYAIKRNRRQFRGKRDRDRAMAEVRVMQRLQTCSALQSSQGDSEKGVTKSSYCLFLLFFIRAWQEDGYFFCQTELCCRDTCRQLMDSLTINWNIAKAAYPSILRNLPTPNGISPGSSDTAGRLVPEPTIWKICHDVCAGLSHIHSQGLVHQDVKPSNIFFITHSRLGVLCKIGDFGMAGEIGITEDGQEGDTAYMAPELLSTAPRHASADIFSLGLTIYELACARVGWRLPTDGQRWHDLRDGDHTPDLPPSRSDNLSQLIRRMTNPDADGRPSPGDILDGVHLVRRAGTIVEQFLTDYVKDVDEFDKMKEEEATNARREAYERRMTPTPPMSALRGAGGDATSGDRSHCVRTPTPDSSGFHALRS